MTNNSDYADLFEDFPELQHPDVILKKEVLSHFGLLFSSFALLEMGLQNLFIRWRLGALTANGEATPENWDSLNGELEKKAFAATFGSLLKLVSDCEDLGPAREGLEKLKKQRDYFAHHFFREENDKMLFEETTLKLIFEMNEVRKLVRLEDVKVDEIGLAMLQKLYPNKDLNAEIKALADKNRESILSNPPTRFGWKVD